MVPVFGACNFKVSYNFDAQMVPVFGNLPKYLSDALKGIQKRARRIILSNLHYDEALRAAARE